MELTKVLNLCAMLFGVVAALFLSKALYLSAEKILRATYHYSPMGWPSVDMISDKASLLTYEFPLLYININFLFHYRLSPAFSSSTNDCNSLNLSDIFPDKLIPLSI